MELHYCSCLKGIRSAVMVAWVLAVMAASPVLAKSTFFVAPAGSDSGNTCRDVSTPCATIKYALQQAANGDVILLAAGTFMETGIIVDRNVSIRGNPAGTIIDGMQTGQRIFTVMPGTFVGMEKLTLKRGLTFDYGGALANSGKLTLREVHVIHSVSEFGGGGIVNYGTLTVRFCRIGENLVAAYGGGIENRGMLTLEDSAIEFNHAGAGAGEGWGAGLANWGTMLVRRSTIRGNEHGGIYTAGDGWTYVTNSTIVGNSGHGAAAFEGGRAGIVYSTITHNSGTYGAFSGGPYTLTANIIFRNEEQGVAYCQGATFVSGGYNVLDLPDPALCSYTDNTGTDVPNLDPLLCTLCKKGGFTLVSPPLAWSPAVDLIPVHAIDCEHVRDQRGVIRPLDGNGDGIMGCDAGAVELEESMVVDPEFAASKRAGEEPDVFRLDQNYPNPFNPTTEIAYYLEEAGHVSLIVYNVLGQEVARLVDASLDEGAHYVTFDGSDLSSGVYLYRIHSGAFSATRHMLLMK